MGLNLLITAIKYTFTKLSFVRLTYPMIFGWKKKRKMHLRHGLIVDKLPNKYVIIRNISLFVDSSLRCVMIGH